MITLSGYEQQDASDHISMLYRILHQNGLQSVITFCEGGIQKNGENCNRVCLHENMEITTNFCCVMIISYILEYNNEFLGDIRTIIQRDHMLNLIIIKIAFEL